MCCYTGRRALLRPGVDTPRLCFPYVEPGTLGQDDVSGLLEHTGDRWRAEHDLLFKTLSRSRLDYEGDPFAHVS